MSVRPFSLPTEARVFNAVQWDDKDRDDVDEPQQGFERLAVRLAAAWSDFDIAEQSALEIIRRFGAIEARNIGLIRLHKHPLFAALQIACVISYTKPFANGNGVGSLPAKYGEYTKPECRQFHEELFVWRDYLSGNRNIGVREFAIARESADEIPSDHFVIGEASAVLEPMKDFGLLREMCADRKALLWPDLQQAISDCYPTLHHPILLSLGHPATVL